MEMVVEEDGDNKSIKMHENKKIVSILRYLPIVLGDLILIYICFNAYLTKWDMSILFFPTMIVTWGIFNFICISIMEGYVKKNNEYYKTNYSKIARLFYVLAFILKYIALGYINFLFIDAIIYRLSLGEDASFPIEPIVFLLIYNISCLLFMWLFRKSRDKEFYNFIMITLPVIVGVIIYILRFR